MKIFIIGPAYPYRGGIADTNEALCSSLIKLGHDCEIVTFKVQYPNFLFPGKSQYKTDPAPKNLTIHRRIHSLNPINWMRVAGWMRKQKPDLVIIRYWLPFMAPCLGNIAKGLKKNIKIVALTDNIIPHEKRPFDERLTRNFTKQCHAFITLSSTVLNELKQFTDKKAIYIPHPINDQLEPAIDRIKARRYLGLNENGKYLLFFGLIRKYKGLDILIDALKFVVKTYDDVKLIVAGEFYDNVDIYSQKIKENGLQYNVILHNRFIPAKEVKYYFSAADLVTQTYRTASQSGITQMAFHFNRPMLVTDVGGLAEIVPHKKAGYVCPLNPEIIGRHIVEFYSEQQSVPMEMAVEEEKKKYSWKNFSKRLIELQDSIVLS